MHPLVEKWFECWEKGNYIEIPITEEFIHESPYGVISGKSKYLEIVSANKDKFLGQSFLVRDYIEQMNKACVRYKVFSEGFEMEVTEWYYFEKSLISKIVAYYNIEGEISESRKLDI